MFGLFFFSPAFSQSSNPSITCSADTGLTIDPQSPLASVYDMDISTMGWSSSQAEEAAEYFESKSGLISITILFSEGRFEVDLDLDNPIANGWGVSEWNDHLSTIL